MQASDPDETAAKQMAAFWQLKQMIEDLAGARFYKPGLTPEEAKLRQAYYTAYYQISQSKPQYKSFAAMRGYDVDPKFRNELIQKLFPPAFAAEYPQLVAQAKGQNQALHNQAEQAGAQAAAKQQAEGQKAYNKLQGDYESGKLQTMPAFQSPEQRAMNRCITAGRLPSSCLGKSLLGGFTQMLSQYLPAAGKQKPPGPTMAGVFAGEGNWRVDFITDGVLVNCSMLSPNQQDYRVEFKNGKTLVVIDTTPKPLVLTLTADGNLVGPGPIVIDGVVPGGYVRGTDNATYQDTSGNRYDAAGNKAISTAGYKTFAPKRTTCPAQNLSSKGAGVGVETMEMNILKMAIGADQGPPVPPGVRMRGIYAAKTGLNVEFFPESAIVACGEPARAYPYQVVANGLQTAIKVEDRGHPLFLNFRSDGTLDPGSGSYLVHGRRITGKDSNGDLTFAPLEASCALDVLVPGAAVQAPPNASTTNVSGPKPGAAKGDATGGASSAGPAASGVQITVHGAPSGNAILSVVSELRGPLAATNTLASSIFVLSHDTFASVFSKAGVHVPTGQTPQLVQYNACSQRTPDCQKIAQAFQGNVAAAVRADAQGKATFAGVPLGTYYVVASTNFNNQKIYWKLKVDLKAGANTVTLDEHNGRLLYPNGAQSGSP